MSTSTTARPAAPVRGRLPAPVRDRRPALAALALLLVLSGALTSALVAYRSGDRIDVLVAAREISVGQEITEADLTIARVASDRAEQVVAAAAKDGFLGTRALTSVPAGTLVNSRMFVTGSVIPPDGLVVGVVLGAAQRPVELGTGDVVRVFGVSSDAALASPATVLVSAARVVDVQGGSGDGFKVSLLVEPSAATAVVAAASAGQVVLTRLSPEAPPAIDFLEP